MLRQFLRKRARIAAGFFNTYVRKKGRTYDDSKWWDDSFYTEGVSDGNTIEQGKSAITAMYHYASVELQILKHLRNNEVQVNRSGILDIGSGSGHWIDFYKALGAGNVTAVDVSHSSFRHLVQKYSGDESVEIHRGKALEVIGKLQEDYDIVNAIGVMFHIVDDAEWQRTILSISGRLKDGGLLIIGGHFGLLDGLNVQIDRNGGINKRLRSKGRWVSALRSAGFSGIDLYRNNAYLWIRDSLPENNVLVATK